MRFNLLLLLLLSNLFILSNETTTCEGETIDQCTACDTGEDSDSCSKCEPGYFPFLGNYFCIACNDSTFGQVGCIGNCDGTNFTTNKNVSCEKEGCVEGFANRDGICYNCTRVISGCSKCIYEVPKNQTYGSYKCLECESNQYSLTSYGECRKCYINGCAECHYSEDYTEQICDKCDNTHYFNEEGECQSCEEESIDGGTCYICSENGTEYDFCECDHNYVKGGEFECLKCPSGCNTGYCLYNNETKDTECESCDSSYALSSDKKCTYCGEGCASCSFDEKDNLVCASCQYSYYTLYNGTCILCESECSKCILNETSEYKNETMCAQCRSGYVFSPEGKCVNCDNIKIGLMGCKECSYNEENKKYVCTECDRDYYAFINNTNQCISNRQQNETNLYGCSSAQYDETNDKYECFSCKSSFLFVEEDKTCRYPSEIGLSNRCQKIVNLGTIDEPKYSCVSCPSYMILVTNISAGTKDCFDIEDEFQYCLEGTIESNGDHNCRRCVTHATVNSSGICECDSDSFGRYHSCYKCDDEDEGSLGCDASKGCILSHYEVSCNECITGYFQYDSEGPCYSCSDEIDYCKECHSEKDGNKTKVICDTCYDMFLLNASKEECNLRDCKEYSEISPGCVICQDKLSEYQPNKKCQFCKDGYFLTKEGTCVYCRSENYGGPGCYECGYEEDSEGKETTIIYVRIVTQIIIIINQSLLMMKMYIMQL